MMALQAEAVPLLNAASLASVVLLQKLQFANGSPLAGILDVIVVFGSVLGSCHFLPVVVRGKVSIRLLSEIVVACTLFVNWIRLKCEMKC